MSPSTSTSSCPLLANFDSVIPLNDRSLLSNASHASYSSHGALVLSPLPPVFTLDLSSRMELPTIVVSSPTRQGKTPLDPLNTDTAVVSSDSPPLLKSLLPHHRAQLCRAWATSPRIPTIVSRRAWAKARNVRPSAVHNWFNGRKSRAKAGNRPIAEGTYDLAVGNPDDDLSLNEEIRPGAFELSPAADSSLSTPSLVPDSPISVTRSSVFRSSPPSPTILSVSVTVKKPICTRKVASKRRAVENAKSSVNFLPVGKWILSMLSMVYPLRTVVILSQLESPSRKPGALTLRSYK